MQQEPTRRPTSSVTPAPPTPARAQATPAPRSALPARTQAEALKAAADIKKLAGQPAEIAARLDTWIDAHTQRTQLPRASGNLRASGTDLGPFLGMTLNAGGPMLLGEAPVADISTGTTRRLAAQQGKTVTRPALNATANDFVVLRAMLGAVSTAAPPAAAAALLIGGVAALTAAELFQSAGGWGLSYALAPDGGRRSEYLSAFNLGMSAQYVVGPVIVTVGVIQHGLTGWMALGLAVLLATLLTGPLVHRAAERPLMRAPEGGVHV